MSIWFSNINGSKTWKTLKKKMRNISYYNLGTWIGDIYEPWRWTLEEWFISWCFVYTILSKQNLFCLAKEINSLDMVNVYDKKHCKLYVNNERGYLLFNGNKEEGCFTCDTNKYIWN
jgi:hypothetical protein